MLVNRISLHGWLLWLLNLTYGFRILIPIILALVSIAAYSIAVVCGTYKGVYTCSWTTVHVRYVCFSFILYPRLLARCNWVHNYSNIQHVRIHRTHTHTHCAHTMSYAHAQCTHTAHLQDTCKYLHVVTGWEPSI